MEAGAMTGVAMLQGVEAFLHVFLPAPTAAFDLAGKKEVTLLTRCASSPIGTVILDRAGDEGEVFDGLISEMGRLESFFSTP